MKVDGDSAITDSISTQNIRLGGITMRGLDSVSVEGSNPSDDEIINERIRQASKDRTNRYQKILGEIDQPENDNHVSITKSTYSIQSSALAGGSYMSMKNKEVRDSVSPTRAMYGRRSPGADDSDSQFISDEEAILRSESENVIEALQSSNPTSKPSSRKTSREERPSSPTKTRPTEIPIKREFNKKPERKTSKSGEKSPVSPTRKSPTTESSRNIGSRKSPTSPTRKVPSSKASPTSPTRSSKLEEVTNKMESSIKDELKKLDSYLKVGLDENDEIINETEEDVVDDSGHEMKMITQTRKNKDGSEFTARTMAQSTKVVDRESDIDEILIGNPDHEVLEREVNEEEGEDGSKIKIITETRRRPDGIEYTTKNVLKTSKIFDYDHPEDVAYCENDELISTDENEEVDEQGATIRTVTETRRKQDGIEYTTKKVYKTSKVSTKITPSDDDEVIDTKEDEEVQADGSIVRIVTETRKTKTGAEYTHRQVFKSRRMTLSALELQKGLPMMNNDDEVLDKKENEEIDESGVKITVVTETRRRKDGSTYSFDYVLRKFQGTEKDIKNIAPVSNNTNIAVSAEDELVKEDVKEEVQADGSTVKTIIERRRAKDGTEYLRHRIMRIPKMPEPVLQVASLNDEVLEEDVNEEEFEDGTKYRAITERRRSSASGLKYTLRRMSKVYQTQSTPSGPTEDVIMDENTAEEEMDDGSVTKTIIKRYQRPDGSLYSTHNVHKSFHSPTPITVTGHEEDELIERSVEEEETDDGYIIKTIIETRERKDGAQYTIEKSEKTAKPGRNMQVSYTSEKHFQTSAPNIETESQDDVVISRDENEYPEDDGTVVTTVVETRRRADGSEYTSKTIQRSIPLMMPKQETSYVVIKQDDKNDDEEPDFMPSLDDEIIYTRKKEEKDEKGNPITVIIETRQSKTTGEKYNITKRVHTTDILINEDGSEKELPKVSQKSIQISSNKEKAQKTIQLSTSNEEPPQDDVPYGSVAALKNRFAPKTKGKQTAKDVKPDKVNTLNKKKFFEDAAKKVESGSRSSSFRSSLNKVNKSDEVKKSYESVKTLSTSAANKEKSSLEVTLNVGNETANVKEVVAKNLSVEPTMQSLEKPKNDVNESVPDFTSDNKENESPGEELDVADQENIEPVKEVKKPKKEEPKTTTRTRNNATNITKKKVETPKPKREVSPRKKPESEPLPKRRSPTSPKQSTSKEISPTRKSPVQKKSPTRKEPKGNTSPQRVPSSPFRGRSPSRSGVSTPRDGTPTGRQCCQRHREQSAQAALESPTENVSPTRTNKPLSRPSTPSAKKQTNGDVRRPMNRVNGESNRKPEDTKSRTKKNETDKPTRSSAQPTRPTRLTETPKRGPASKSPEKTTTRTTGRVSPKSPTKPKAKTSPKSPLSPKSSISKTTVPKSSLSPTKDPIVSLPQTPATEEKPYPGEDGPTIEDVSGQPLAPGLKVHRPSIVREPSEYHELEDEEISSDKDDIFDQNGTEEQNDIVKRNNDINKSFDNKLDGSSVSNNKSLFEGENTLNKTTVRDPVALKDIGIFKKADEISSKLIEDVEKSILPNTNKNEKVVGKNVGKRYNPNEKKSDRPARKISLEAKGSVSSRRSLFERGSSSDTVPAPVKRPALWSSKLNKEKFEPKSTPEPKPVKEPIIVPEKMYLCGDKKVNGEIKENNASETISSSIEDSIVSKTTVAESRTHQKPPFSKENSPAPKDKEGSPAPFSKESSPVPRSKEGSPAPFMKEGSPGRFATGRPIDAGVNTNKIKRLERASSNKKLFEDLEVPKSKLPNEIANIESITDVSTLEIMVNIFLFVSILYFIDLLQKFTV